MSKKPKSGPHLEPIRKPRMPRRNEPCPCGSGKKAKRCCLPRMGMLAALTPETRTRIMMDSIFQKPTMVIPEPVIKAPEIDIENCTLAVQSETIPETP